MKKKNIRYKMHAFCRSAIHFDILYSVCVFSNVQSFYKRTFSCICYRSCYVDFICFCKIGILGLSDCMPLCRQNIRLVSWISLIGCHCACKIFLHIQWILNQSRVKKKKKKNNNKKKKKKKKKKKNNNKKKQQKNKKKKNIFQRFPHLL